MKQRVLVLSAAMVGLTCLWLVVGRTARVKGARVAHIEGASMPFAEVVLDYSRGPRPARVIVDVRGQHGGGSTTVEGDEDIVRMPLTGMLGQRYTIDVMATTRVLGRLQTQQARFQGEVAQLG